MASTCVASHPVAGAVPPWVSARRTKRTPLSTQLEIETYTWDVLPDHLKTGDIVDYVCRELEWVKGVLEGVAAPLH